MSGTSYEGVPAHPDWQFIWKPFRMAALLLKIEETLGYRIPPKMETNASTREQAAEQSAARQNASNAEWRKL